MSSLRVGISAMRRSVAPNGMRVMEVRGLVESTGLVGGASAALWATFHESKTLPCRDTMTDTMY